MCLTQDDDVGRRCAALSHVCEELVTRRVDERDGAFRAGIDGAFARGIRMLSLATSILSGVASADGRVAGWGL